MPKKLSASTIQAALRKAQQEHNRQFKRAQAKINHEVDQHNRKVEQHNQKVVANFNRQVDSVNRHNQQAFNQLTTRLHAAESRPTVRYTVEERQLADRVQGAILA